MSSIPSNRIAEPHYSSFEPEAQRELFKLIRRSKQLMLADSVMPIPIFVITCDRLTALVPALLSYYKNLREPITVIIHDNSTTYPPTLEFLERLAEEGIPVFRSNKVTHSPSSLSSVRNTIKSWYETHDSPYYIVTDPDIEIEQGAEDMLAALKFLLTEYKFIDAVGPMLRKDNIPDHYPLKEAVHAQQDKLYLPEKKWVTKWQTKALMLQSGWIDTAFALYRKDFKFRNLNRSIQTFEPYVARHSDWYINPFELAPDQIYYKIKNSPVGHWSSTWLADTYLKIQIAKNDPRQDKQYRVSRERASAE